MKALRAIAVAVALVVPALAAPQGQLPPEIAAKVNDEVISTKEVADRTLQLYGQQELRTLIYYRLVEQEAERLGVVVTEQQVEDEIEKMRQRAGERFRDYVASLGLTERLLPAQVRHELYVRELIGKNIDVTEEEIEEFYNAPEHKSRYHKPEMVRLRVIITDERAQAEAALAELKRGVKFADVVAKYSVDEPTKRRNGELGMYLARGAFVPEWKALEDQAFALPLNKVSGVIAVGEKFMIIEVIEKQGAVDIALARAHEDIREEIFKAKLDEKARAWLSDLFRKASKEINGSLWE